MSTPGQSDHWAALGFALQMQPRESDPATLLALADRLLSWSSGTGPPVEIVITAGPVRDQASTPPGVPMQIHDNEEFDLSLSAVDSKGEPVPDTFTTTVDNADVITLVPSADGSTVTLRAGIPGSAVVTVSDGTRTATESVDVVPGDVATISITEGPVRTQA